MTGIFDLTTILFLVLAVVIFLRLRNALGRRTGHERPPFDPYSSPKPNGAGNDKVVSLPQRGSDPVHAPAAGAADWGDHAPADSPLAEGFAAIHAADPDFHPASFIDGARMAYEMIVTAFAEGDRKTLKGLLSREVYDGFIAAISDHESRGETVTSNFVGIDKARITGAEMHGKVAHVTIRFVSQLVTATRDKEGNIVQGDPNQVAEVIDIWTFARDTSTGDPNWKLVATEAAE